MNYRSLMVTVALCMLAGSASAADIYAVGVSDRATAGVSRRKCSIRCQRGCTLMPPA